MHRRPWSLVFLAIFNLIVPIVNLSLIYIDVKGRIPEGKTFFDLLILPENLSWVLTITIPSLVAAYAIFVMKKWSYPLYMISMAWIVGYNVFNFHEMTAQTIVEFLFFNGINILLVSYFLIPAVRNFYFNPRLRWWESATRYEVDLPIRVGDFDGRVTDISNGGVFCQFDGDDEDLDVDTSVKVHLDYEDLLIDDKARVVYKVPGKNGYGLQFLFENDLSRESLEHFIKKLKKSNHPYRGPQTTWQEDLKNWLVQVFTKGEGIIPKT